MIEVELQCQQCLGWCSGWVGEFIRETILENILQQKTSLVPIPIPTRQVYSLLKNKPPPPRKQKLSLWGPKMHFALKRQKMSLIFICFL